MSEKSDKQAALNAFAAAIAHAEAARASLAEARKLAAGLKWFGPHDVYWEECNVAADAAHEMGTYLRLVYVKVVAWTGDSDIGETAEQNNPGAGPGK